MTTDIGHGNHATYNAPVLRIAAVFLVALVLGAAGGGVLISRLVPPPVPTPTEAVTSPGDPDAPAVAAAAPAAAAAVRDPMQHLPA